MNPFQGTNAGGSDSFVTKLSPDGNSLAYSTYLGGSGDDHGYDVVVDGNSNTYVAGLTYSANFPTQNPYQSTKGGGGEAFVTKLTPGGDILAYSTYLGGNSDDGGLSVAVDSSGNAYLTGFTQSTTFPTMNPYQGIYKGYYADAFVTKLNPEGNALVYSTFLGGSSLDQGQSIAIDSSGKAYITGRTVSTDFPTLNPLQATKAYYYDAFVTKLSPEGNALAYSTYLGGSGDDEGLGIAVDSSGNAYITGSTESSDFPTQNTYQGTFGGLYDAFATKLNTGGNAMAYSTYLGGSSYDSGYGIALDASGNAYITGYTRSTNFPTQNPKQASNAGYDDAFMTVISSSDLVPGISLIKMTNGEDANSPPGPYISVGGTVTWTYDVTNTGNVDLTNIQVTDDILGPIGTIPLLSPGQSEILTATGVASAGQYSNFGVATGTTPSSSTVSAEDASHYYGNTIPNNPPNTPSIPLGQDAGFAGTFYSFSTSATDPDKDQVKYIFDWGDGNLDTTSLTDSGSITSASHSWKYVGTYNVKVKATDSKGAFSGWSDTLIVTITNPVVLVHGIFSTPEAWNLMRLNLESEGLKVYTAQYALDKIGTMGDIKYFAGTLSIEISRILAETGAKKVDIVAHSMGGLVSRWYIEKGDGANKVDKLVMLGTPNSGSELCYFLPGTNPFARLKQLPLYIIYGISPEIAPGFALEQMAPGSPFLMSLGYSSRPNYYIIAGTNHNEGVLWWSGKILSAYDLACFGCNPKGNDGAVRYISATLFDTISHRYDFAVDHFHEASDPIVMNQVYSILTSGTEGSSSQLSNQEISGGIKATNEMPAQSLPAIIGKIYPSEEKHHPINITSTEKAQFYLIGQYGNISLNLTTPSGISIDKSSDQNENNITYNEDINPTLKSYAINNPEPGMWMADVKAIDISLEGEYYTILPFIDSNLTLDVNPTKYQFKPNEPIELKANLSNNSSPATGASVTAHYLKPDKLMENISLYDDGQHNDSQANDGIYACTFTNSSLSGAYQVMVSANGTLDSQAFQLQESTIVWAEAYPDLNVSSADISFSNSSPLTGQDVILNATIHNSGEATANNSFISFYDGSPESGELIANVSLNISARSTENIETIWNAVAGHHEIFVWISPYNSFLELNYSNNMANKSINVRIANNSCISGTKFNDSNSNATRDPGEAGLSGWTIRLTRPDGTAINATTDANGSYKFENLTSGTYRVSEIRQSNWTQTYPAWMGDHIINVTDGNVTGVDFGNNYLPVPEIPFPPSGPASGIPGAQYSYSTSSTDPSGYQIAYTFDWGDGSNTTTGLFDSGAVASAAHIWNSSGVYQVRAMATNSKGASSGWSDALEVDIAAGIIPDQIGVFRNGGLYFDANGDRYWTAGDTTGWFGTTGDLPVAGDWDGDGKDEIAVFRNGGWYFDANGDGYWSTGDATGWFGATGDMPAAGDWDGDGKDEIAVFRNGGWYFDANGDGYWTTGDTTGWFGATGDLPAAGDWDGDGKDEIAVFRNGGWYFDANGDRYWTTGDTTGWFGAGGDRPVAGRWRSPLSSSVMDNDRPQLDLDQKVEPSEKIRQKRAALKDLEEESRDQVREIKISQKARQ